MALLEGEPGIGKTRLAGELALQATADDALVLFGACDEGGAHPYQPFAHALAPYLDDKARDVYGARGARRSWRSERFLVGEAVMSLLSVSGRERRCS